MTLREHISEALTHKRAIGHFNISTLDGIWAVVDAAAALKLPVLIGVSEGERDYVGVREAAAIVKSIREERKQPIFLNADHTYSFERVKEAVDAGYDAVIYDGSALPYEENAATAKKCVEYAKKSGMGVIIEGELGFIGTSSKVLDAIPAGAVVGEAQMTKPEVAARFARETGVDMLAPAVGNIHGMVRGGDPALNWKRVKEISEAVKLPLVLHGASGNTADDIKKTVASGVAIVHVNTELRVAYRSGLVRSLSDNPDEVAPYKYLKPAKLAMQKVVEEKLRIISGM
ncbi:MAG: fructose-bisphosphate aldolase, class [Candidatus Parcubacteria bacterium]|jgi:fructose-bisphosphate aldolase class II|nr:fructose-bisphosphate aldolase, class [Candidatus Parcubacteria bacterium]